MIKDFIDKIAKWSLSQENITKVYLVGSYANDTAKADSDVDILVLSSDPESYLKNKNWINEFGDVDNYKMEYYGKVTSIRVFYKNSYEVEFGITDNSWDSEPCNVGTKEVLTKGFKLLYKKIINK